MGALHSHSESIVFFGGAGVSTESNIPDFRSEEGLYNTINSYGFSQERILSNSYFLEYTDIFYDYYKKNLIAQWAEPNAAHKALAVL